MAEEYLSSEQCNLHLSYGNMLSLRFLHSTWKKISPVDLLRENAEERSKKLCLLTLAEHDSIWKLPCLVTTGRFAEK